MSRRLLYLDRSPGEIRGVVTLDGEPERLLIQRSGDDPALLAGARHAARVTSAEPALGLAFLDLGAGNAAILPFKPDAKPRQGELMEVEIRSEPRRDKLAVARRLRSADGAPGLLAPPPEVEHQLRALARDAEIVEGREARRIADQAESEALALIHPIPGGGEISIEPTRALVAVDVDVGERKGGDAKRVTRQANLAAIAIAARLLRLKGLGGLIVVDLAGRGHDGAALMTAARSAFGPDNPGVAMGPVSKFGTMEITVPRRSRPVADLLCDASGRLSDRALAQRLIRRLEDEARADPGARLVARAAPDVVSAATPLCADLIRQVGARVALSADPGLPRDRIEIGPP